MSLKMEVTQSSETLVGKTTQHYNPVGHTCCRVLLIKSIFLAISLIIVWSHNRVQLCGAWRRVCNMGVLLDMCRLWWQTSTQSNFTMSHTLTRCGSWTGVVNTTRASKPYRLFGMQPRRESITQCTLSPSMDSLTSCEASSCPPYRWEPLWYCHILTDTHLFKWWNLLWNHVNRKQISASSPPSYLEALTALP